MDFVLVLAISLAAGALVPFAPSASAQTVLKMAHVYPPGNIWYNAAEAYAKARSLRLADGPDEVHRESIARMELKRFESSES